VGSKVRVGYDPDDLAILDDGQTALVLTSGHAEGESNRPDPALSTWGLGDAPRLLGQVDFDRPGDDPDRVTLSARGQSAAVRLLGSNEVASTDLADRERPRIVGRSALPARDLPYPSASADDWLLMPVGSDRETVLVPPPGSESRSDPRAVVGSMLV